MIVDPNIVFAILALFGIGVLGIVQTLKTLLKLTGTGAIVLTFVVSFGATAIYLLQAHTFAIPTFIIYGLLVAGEASGLYRVVKKPA
jgi:hypothetical protein